MITYVQGDATEPSARGTKVICHCVNDIGSWGAGFVLSLKKWPEVERAYRAWYRSGVTPLELPLRPENSTEASHFGLGSVQFVQVREDLWVANIVGQHLTIRLGERTPIRYEALEQGFAIVHAFCRRREATAHMPRLGAGLARGKWVLIEQIIDRALTSQGVAATVYDPV